MFQWKSKYNGGIEGYTYYPCPNWWMLNYYNKSNHYYRQQEVQQERVRWYRDTEEVNLRPKRNPKHLNRWGGIEKTATIFCSKSWKHLYKKRKQWMRD